MVAGTHQPKINVVIGFADSPEQISTFAYDESINPFRNLFIPYMSTHIYTCCEEIGPNFLSYNTVKETTRTYTSTSNTISFPFERNVFGVKLMSCSYFDQYNKEYFYD